MLAAVGQQAVAKPGQPDGLDFLRHIERCAVLVHVVDCATADPGRDPISDIDALEAELAAYTPTLQGDAVLGVGVDQVVAEGGVLGGIQDLHQGRRGVAAEVPAQLVHLVQH